MRRRRSAARPDRARARGFTMSEVLVGLSIASIVIIGVGTGFVWITKAWVEHQARAQAQQSLRAAVESLARETRLAGACMPLATLPPVAPNFHPLAGVSGPPDSITVTSNPLCAGPTSLTADCLAPCSVINVDNTTNFQAGTWAFIYNSDPGTGGPYGEFFLVQSVAAGSPGTITVNPSFPLQQSYPQLNAQQQSVSAVYGADQRTFAIGADSNGNPVLTLSLLNGQTLPLVKGIDQMSVTYILNRAWDPSTCSAQTGGTLSLCVVSLPVQSPSVPGDWQLVRAVTISLDARSIIPVRGSGTSDGFFHQTETFEVSPRNFMFQGAPRVNWTPY